MYHAMECSLNSKLSISHLSRHIVRLPYTTMQHHTIPCNAMQYHAIQRNTMQYKHHARQNHTTQYHAKQCKTPLLSFPITC